jgi:hypothetical protein
VSLKDLRKLSALPWGSRVGLCSDDRDIAIVSGPAQLVTHWYLPVISPPRSNETDTIERLKKEAERSRKTRGCMPIQAAEFHA